MRLFPLLLLAGLLGSAGLFVRGQINPSEPFRSAGDRPIDIHNLRLDLDVDLPSKTVTGQAALSFTTLRRASSLRLDAVDFEIKGVTLAVGTKAAAAVRHSHDGKHLDIDYPEVLPADTAATLIVRYQVRDPKAGLHFFGPSKADPDVPLTVWSQGEPITNRYWIPCLDQPNVRQCSELVVTGPDGFEVLSNGALVSRKPDADRKKVVYHWKQDKPHPSYLITMVIGRFDVIREEWTAKEGRALPVLYYVPAGRKPDVARTFGRTREMLDFFSRRFGVAYPWEKYAQVVVEQFTHGGMENTSATTLTERALHDQRAFLDSSPDALIAHELAHQWWGDMVTCRDWAHLWLNEGFASYCEALWDEHSKGRDTYAYTMVLKSRSAITGGKARPIVDRGYANPRTMFDARAYPKGAFVLHMLRARLGERAFWKGIQTYGKDHRFQSVETTDLRRTMERISGRDLERFFHDWTERPGHPVVEVKSEYDAERKQVRISVKQTQAGPAFHFPLEIRLGMAGSKDIRVVEDVKHKEERITLAVASRPARVEIDPENAVLAVWHEQKGNDLWLAQLLHGSAVPARIRAATHLGEHKSAGDRAVLAKALPLEKFCGVQVEIASALGASGGDISRDALIAGLKHSHPKVRRACAEQLSTFARDPRAAAALKELLAKGDASYFVEAAAVASYATLRQPGTVELLLPWLAKPSHAEVIRNATLKGLATTEDLSALDTLIQWTKRGKPRFCRLTALAATARLVSKADPSAKQQKRALTALTDCLAGEAWPIRLAAVRALQTLGRSARPAVDTVETLLRQEPDDRVRDAAQQALASMRAAGSDAEVKRLRQELEKLRSEQAELRDRVERKDTGAKK